MKIKQKIELLKKQFQKSHQPKLSTDFFYKNISTYTRI